MRKRSIAAILILFLQLSAQSTNTISVASIANVNLLLPGYRQTIGLVVISNDYPNAFDVTFTFGNFGKLIRAGGSNTLQFSELLLQGGGGQLGQGLSTPENFDLLSGMESGSVTWNPGLSQQTPTQNYVLRIVASWNTNRSVLAGLYSEQISVVITPRH